MPIGFRSRWLALGPACLAACAPSEFPNPNGMPSDQAGFSVAVDGERAIVGVPRSDTLDSNSGKALLYHRSGNTWPLEASIVQGTPSLGANFGWSVDISGERAIVGAFTDASLGFITGAAYIFEWAGTAWTETAKLAVDSIGESGYALSVAISGDYAVVGAPYPPPPTFLGSGVAWLYRRNPGNGKWNPDTVLTASDAVDFIEFGSSVSIDGDILVVGAEKGVAGNTVAGAAYVFRRQGSVWSEEAKLVAADPAYHDRFGDAVSVSGDRIAVGAKEADPNGDASGATYVFAHQPSSTSWVQLQKITPMDGAAGDNFGYSVSIDGGRLLAGAWLADGAGSTTGAAYVFRTVGSSWEQADKLILADGAYGDGYGASVSLSGDCGVVGAPDRDRDGDDKVGAAFYYCGLPGPLPPVFELDIICCVEVPDPLGPVVLTTRMRNSGAQDRIGRHWIEAVSPTGIPARVIGPASVIVSPGETLEARHAFRLPAGHGDGPSVLRLHWQDDAGVRTVSTTYERRQ